MNTDELLKDLIEQLWHIGRMDIMAYIEEFNCGETALLWFLLNNGEANPSSISDGLNLSRARVAKILSSLRAKKYITMDISEADRRKMTVRLTEEGRESAQSKYAFLEKYLGSYVKALGEEDVSDLVRLLKRILSCSAECVKPDPTDL